MAAIAPDGPYKMQKTLRKLFLIRLPMSPGPRDSPSLAGRGTRHLQVTEWARALDQVYTSLAK